MKPGRLSLVAPRARTPSHSFFYHYTPGPQRPMRIFHAAAGRHAYPFLAISTAVFELEKALRQRRIEQAVVSLTGGPYRPGDLARIAAVLRGVLQYTLVEDVEFSFSEVAPPPPKRIRTPFDLQPVRDVCLFSGGVDSYVGLWWATVHLNHVAPVFCAHSDQSWTIRLVGEIHEEVFRRRRTHLRQVYVPAISKQGYAQLRGLLYFVSAGAWMQLLGASRLIITEVGPTMYQPKFAPFDMVTLTTHPYVVGAAKAVLEILLQRSVEIVTPFANMTKAEVIALAPAAHGIGMTHSCISQRFGTHDGTCYGCVVRRLGALAAGVDDVSYRRDPLLDAGASRGNLLALLRFSLDFLTGRQTMEEYEIGDILRFGKEELFQRFALDNLAALHQLVRDGRRLVPDVGDMYRAALQALGGAGSLEARLAMIRARRSLPAF